MTSFSSVLFLAGNIVAPLAFNSLILLEVHLDLVSCPSARSRRDRESPFEIEMRRDHLTSETAEISLEIMGRDQGFTRDCGSRSGQYDVTTYVRYVYRCMYRDTTVYISVCTYVHIRTPSRISCKQGCRDRDVCSIEISRISSRGARSRCTSRNLTIISSK